MSKIIFIFRIYGLFLFDTDKSFSFCYFFFFFQIFLFYYTFFIGENEIKSKSFNQNRYWLAFTQGVTRKMEAISSFRVCL